MNSLTRIMSYDKTKNVNQTVQHSSLTEDEIERIIREKYNYKDEKTKKFIRKALQKHGDKYNYSNVIYINAHNKIKIICQKHGEFLQTPNGHLNTNGCKKCANEKLANERRMTKEEFIKNANKVHGEGTYDYSKVNYVNAYTKIIIICPKHDEFLQKPDSHLHGCGCPLCGVEKQAKNHTLTIDEFINKSNEVHGIGKYDYSKVMYKNNDTKVIIICHNHDEPYEFKQKPSSHMMGKGCTKCKGEKLANERKLNLKEFIDKSNKIHGVGTYDYSKVIYKNNNTKVIIICPKHGEFKQTPSNHLNSQGCPKCNNNKGENAIRKFLIEQNIEFEEQKTFEGCKNINLLKFDFYLPKYNLCIESDGNVHSKKINWNGKLTDEQMEKELKLNQHRDNIKNEYCKKNDITLLRVNNLKAVKELTEYFQTHGIIKEQTIFDLMS